jgi:hypothetical protein
MYKGSTVLLLFFVTPIFLILIPFKTFNLIKIRIRVVQYCMVVLKKNQEIINKC